MPHWYSWQHIYDVGDKVEGGELENARQYATLKDICDTVSRPKREYLYNRLKNAGFSLGTLDYLFGVDSVISGYDDVTITENQDYEVVVSR